MKVNIGMGFVLMTAVFYFFDESGIFAATLVSAAVHELGHFLAIVFFGSKVLGVNLEITGAVIFFDNSRISYHEEMIIAFMGPLLGIVFAIISAAAGKFYGGFFVVSGISFSLSLLNLLPSQNLDGGRALYAFLARTRSRELADKVMVVSSCITAFAVLSAGLYILLVLRGSISFLVVGLWMLTDFIRVSRVTV